MENMNVMLASFIGGWEMVLILAVVLVLFGAKKLPELAKGLGQGIKEFRKATRDVQDELQSALDDTPPPPRRYPVSNPEPTHSLPSSSTVTTEPATPATPASPDSKVKAV
jgi:sec-independent protein translocase protein TatA